MGRTTTGAMFLATVVWFGCAPDNEWNPAGGPGDVIGDELPTGDDGLPAGDGAEPGYQADPSADMDADGHTPAGGDCDDQERNINPMAFEVPGNLRDDDCDGTVDEAPDGCDCGAGASLAAGLDLCDSRFLLSFEQRFAAPGAAAAAGVVPRYGGAANGLAPRMGCGYTILSTGPIGTEACSSPFSDCRESPRQPGMDFYDDGRAYCEQGAIGEADPSPMGPDGGWVCDSQQLVVRLRAPSNASGFSFDFLYLSTEYPEWVAQGFNDTFYAIIDRPAAGERLNISFDESGHEIEVDNAFFEDPPRTDISGTGYDGICDQGFAPAPCGSSTGWLRTSWNVEPGEELSLTFSIHDEGDGWLDSAVILDGFQWSLNEVAPGTEMIY